MRIAVGKRDFAHDDEGVVASCIRIEGYWLEHAIGVAAVRLLSRAAVESPKRTVVQGFGRFGRYARLAAEIWNGRVAVEPDVFELVFSHIVVVSF